MTKIILGIFVVGVLFVIGTYWYISTDWKKYYTEDEIRVFVKEIEKVPKLSESFYGVYDKLHYNDRHKSMTAIYSAGVWNEIIMDNQKYQTPWALRAASFFPKKKSMREYSDFKLALGLEKFTTTEKCFDFSMNIENKMLMKNDTSFKVITQIKDTTEIIEYLIKKDAPYYYKLHPDSLKLKISEVKTSLLNKI